MRDRLNYYKAAPDGGIAILTLAVAVINAWNRVAVSFRTSPAR